MSTQTDSSFEPKHKLRQDLLRIGDLIAPGSRVLDSGCADGSLLEWLRDERDCIVRGIDIDQEAAVLAVERGIPVICGDIENELALFPDASFDAVILAQSLQEVAHPARVLAAALRVGREVIVSYPNFGHWRTRGFLFARGRMPVSPHIPYSWHETPSIHHTTVADFRDFVCGLGAVIKHEVFFRVDSAGRGVEVVFAPQLRAETVITVLGHDSTD